MRPDNKTISDNDKANEINVKTVNKPTKEDGKKKIKELSEFLSKTWQLPINSQ